jgi:hypothetical protein
MALVFWSKHYEAKAQLRYVGVYCKIILKWAFETYSVKMWSELNVPLKDTMAVPVNTRMNLRLV